MLLGLQLIIHISLPIGSSAENCLNPNLGGNSCQSLSLLLIIHHYQLTYGFVGRKLSESV